MKKYKIYRYFQKQGMGRKLIKSGLTLKEAQAHCNDPETSSLTATKGTYKGCKSQWFDGYTDK